MPLDEESSFLTTFNTAIFKTRNGESGNGTGMGTGMGMGMGTRMHGNGNGNGSGNGSGKKTSFKKRISCEKYNLYFVSLTDRKLCVSTKYKLQKTNVVNYLKKQLSREMSKLLKFNVHFIH